MPTDDKILPKEYEDREQAFVKHTVLAQYLMRLMMIVGQDRAGTIGFVDGFAGPWKSKTDDLSDTSIGISIEKMLEARKGYLDRGWKCPNFKALYIEKDPERSTRLQQHIAEQRGSLPQGVAVEAWQGDFIERLDEVLEYFDTSDFVFFFIDPTGWKDVSMSKLLPLLERPNSEILINFMYDFVNRAASQEEFEGHMRQMFGDIREPNLADIDDPVEREVAAVRAYRDHLNSALPDRLRFRTAYVRIKDPQADRAKYHLIYLTRHSKGIIVFMEESEAAEREIQPAVRAEAAVRREEEKTGQRSLFAVPQKSSRTEARPAMHDLRQAWLKRIGVEPKRFTQEDEADLLEETDCFPKDLQESLRQLITDGVVENLDAKRYRKKNVVNFQKQERLQRVRRKEQR